MQHGKRAHQLPGHDLPHVHEVIDEAVLLPVDAMDLPRELALALAFVLLIHSLFHLALEVQNYLFDKFPSLHLVTV